MPQKCLLIGLAGSDAYLQELAALVESNEELVVSGTVVQNRSRPDSRFYLGKGKTTELKAICDELEIDVIVADDELSVTQQRNLQEIVGRTVTDRTGIILDIFSRRAHTAEGKIQVELARLKYILPRLTGRGRELSRLGAGIGTRGPGESKLESDRRTIRQRIRELEREIDAVTGRQEVTRKQRQKQEIPEVCLVGYTNAGKSSLMAKMTHADSMGDSRLFATLTTTGYRIDFGDGGHFILSDTVGFINKLPHQLVASFRATLREVVDADLLLHVIDISEPGIEERVRTVEKVLEQIGASQKPELRVYNKIDLISPKEIEQGGYHSVNSILVSAWSGMGLDELMLKIRDILAEDAITISLRIPYNRGDLIAVLYDKTQIISRDDKPDGVDIEVKGSGKILSQVLKALEAEMNDEYDQ